MACGVMTPAATGPLLGKFDQDGSQDSDEFGGQDVRRKIQAQAQAKMSPSQGQDEIEWERQWPLVLGRTEHSTRRRRVRGVYLDLDLEEKGDPVFKLKLQYMFGIKRRHRAYLDER